MRKRGNHESRLTFIRNTTPRIVTSEGRVKNPRALYKCSCGNEVETSINNFKTGSVKSCGCLSRDIPNHYTHGLHDHPLYRIWQGIKRRCYGVTEPVYHLYGGRGVKMCDEWLNHPENFISWCLANGWRKGLNVDKDIKGDGLLYSPETCSIITSRENNNHRRNNRKIEFNGRIQTLAQWSRETGLKEATIHIRIGKYKWSVERALTEPNRQAH